MLQRQSRRHVATTGARRTVDAESTPTEHREREGKDKDRHTQQLGIRDVGHIHRRRTLQGKRDRVGGQGSRTTATHRRRRDTPALTQGRTQGIRTKGVFPPVQASLWELLLRLANRRFFVHLV